MLIIKDEWGKIICESEDYDEILKFGQKYKEDNNLPHVTVLKKSGGFHCFI